MVNKEDKKKKYSKASASKTEIIYLNFQDFFKKNKMFFLFFIILSGASFLWWLAFYPGPMSPDSLVHWVEAQKHSYFNWHPFFYSFVLSCFFLLKQTPAWMGLLQISIFSLIIAFLLAYAYKKKAPLILILLTIGFYALLPQFGILNITIWKDILYSLLALATSVLTFIVVLKGRDKSNLLYLLATLAGLTAVIRFNGLVYLVLVPLALFLFKAADLKQLGKYLLVSFGVFLVLNVGLFKALKVTPAPLVLDQLRVKLVGAIYNKNNPTLTKEENEVFSKLMTSEEWRRYYDCFSSNDLFFEKTLNRHKIKAASKGISPDEEYVKKWEKYFITASLSNPDAIISDRLCIGKYLIGLKPGQLLYFDNIYSDWRSPKIPEESYLPALKTELKDYLAWSKEGEKKRTLFWSIWPSLIFYSIMFIVALFKRKMALVSFILLITANVAAMVVLAPAPDYRYVYMVYLGVLLLPVMYVIDKKNNE